MFSAFDRIAQEYDKVETLHSEVMHLIHDNLDMYARIDGYAALDRAMQRGTASGQLASLRELKAELAAPFVQTCPTCGLGQGDCCCSLSRTDLEPGDELPV